MAGFVASYIHGHGEIGVLVELGFSSESLASHPEVVSLGYDLAVHIAAMQPKGVQPSDLSASEWDSEVEQLSRSASFMNGSPEQRAEILSAARKRFEGHFALLKQPFIKGSRQFVEDRLAQVEALVGEPISVVQFARFAPPTAGNRAR